ncbi:MAG: hypothetical protein R2784_11795 [Saprospiraceae bacterium]
MMEKEVIKTLIHPTAMFGELGIIGEQKRVDLLTLKEEVHLYVVKVDDFKRKVDAFQFWP